VGAEWVEIEGVCVKAHLHAFGGNVLVWRIWCTFYILSMYCLLFSISI